MTGTPRPTIVMLIMCLAFIGSLSRQYQMQYQTLIQQMGQLIFLQPLGSLGTMPKVLVEHQPGIG